MPDRVAALLLDALALTIVALAVAVVVSLALGPAVRFHTEAGGLDAAVELRRGVATLDALLTAVVGAAYFVAGWRRGATPGQRVLGIDVAAGGGAPSTGAAALRWFLLVAPFALAAFIGTALPAVSVLVDALAAAWYLALLITTARSPTGRGLHDRAAGTVVTRAARLAAIAPDHRGAPHAR